MLRILETESNCKAALDSLSGRPAYIHVLYADPHVHPACNKPTLAYVTALDDRDGDEFIFPFNQADCANLSMEGLAMYPTRCFIYDVKSYMYHSVFSIDYNDMLDARLFMYYHENIKVDGLADMYQQFDRMYARNSISFTPTLRLYDGLKSIRDAFKGMLDEHLVDHQLTKEYEAFDHATNYVFYTIESAGLRIDEPQLLGFFPTAKPVGKMLWSKYNYYTLTGRPSNAFNGINFAALNKSSGVRASFVSRHGDRGRLIQFDFSAYHPRLISKLVNYPLRAGQDIYVHLGSYYFGKPEDEVTPEEAKQAKLITFTQMYGSINQRYEGIPYFSAISKYITELWHRFEHYGYIETPIFRRRLYAEYYEDMNPSKLFNYIVQVYETERNITVLYKLAERLSVTQTQMVLYTYDSILLDFKGDDGKSLLLDVARIMEDGYFPVKVTGGKNYSDMVDIYPKDLT